MSYEPGFDQLGYVAANGLIGALLADHHQILLSRGIASTPRTADQPQQLFRAFTEQRHSHIVSDRTHCSEHLKDVSVFPQVMIHHGKKPQVIRLTYCQLVWLLYLANPLFDRLIRRRGTANPARVRRAWGGWQPWSSGP